MTRDRIVLLSTEERHRVLDLIVAQWVSEQQLGTGLRNSSIMDLLEWHYRKLQKEETAP